jgi:MYXO-CTERM domain-containing protein
MRSSSWLATLSAAFAVIGVAPFVRAQVTSVSVTTTPTRQLTDGSYYPSHIVDGTNQGIGYLDCVNDTEIVFPLTIAGLPDTTVTFEIWAGTGDCTASGATNNASTGTCWPVAPNPVPQAVMSVPIRVQDIVSQLGITPPAQSYSSALPAVCTTAASSTTTTVTDDSGVTSTTSGVADVSIFFMFFPTGSSVPSVTATPYPLEVKLSGPGACTGLTGGSGDGEIVLNWDPPSGETDIQGYNLFAQPVGATGMSDGAVVQVCPDAGQQGTELVDDAGDPIFDDAGNPIFVDDAGNPIVQSDAGCYNQYVPSSPTGCSSGSNGSIDTTNAALACTDAGATNVLCSQVNGTTNSSGTISGLADGTSYAVAVAAFDEFGNLGQISNVVCATPAPINDFWKVYNQDGGNAGFCALEVVGGHGSPAAAGLAGIVAFVMIRRRKKRMSP